MHGAKKHLSRLLKPKSAQAGTSNASNVSQPPSSSDATDVGLDMTSNEPTSSTGAANIIGQVVDVRDAADGTIPSGTRANIRKAGDTTINALNTSLAILKEVTEALHGVPLVKSLSGIVLVLIKIRDVRRLILFQEEK